LFVGVGEIGAWFLILIGIGVDNFSNSAPQDGQNFRLSGRSELQLEHFMIKPIRATF